MNSEDRRRSASNSRNSRGRGPAGRSSYGRNGTSGSRSASASSRDARNPRGTRSKDSRNQRGGNQGARGQRGGNPQSSRSQRPERGRGNGSDRRARTAGGQPPRKNGPSRKTAPATPSKRNRAVTIAVVALLIVAVVAVAAFMLISSATRSLEERQAILDSVQEREIAAPIAECTSSNLDFKIGEHSTTATVGNGWRTDITVTNTGSEPCLTDGSASSIGLVVSSGSYQLVDTTVCGDPENTKPLLIGNGRSWNTTLSWDGKDYQDCNAGDVASAGTYVMKIKFLDEEKGEVTVQLQD